MFYSTSPAKLAESRLTSVALYTSRRPKRETILPCGSFRPLIAPAIMPIEAKLANDTRNTERMPSPRD